MNHLRKILLLTIALLILAGSASEPVIAKVFSGHDSVPTSHDEGGEEAPSNQSSDLCEEVADRSAAPIFLSPSDRHVPLDRTSHITIPGFYLSPLRPPSV